jgi:hypothetical protein
MGGVDHQLLRLAAFSRQFGQNPVEHAPSLKGAKQSDAYDAIVEEKTYETPTIAIATLPKIVRAQRRRNRRTSGPARCREDNKKGRGEIAPTLQTSLFTPVPVHPWSKVR